MICKKCGCETPSNSNFCSHCGVKIDFDNEFNGTVEPAAEVRNEKKEEEPKPDEKYFNRYREESVDTGHANPAWYYLGFFCPIAGFILFYIYCYKKPDLAYKCRRGAIAGILFDVFIALISILLNV